LIEISVAALVGGAVGAMTCRWLARQKIERLQQRLARAEEARNGALERSENARDQIALLSKAISDLRRAHQPARAPAAARPSTPEERRAAAERALAQASDGVDRDADPDGKAPVFASTQPMEY
jgi:chromosome segregation ATPase